jgi:hypothetical protein
MMRHAARSCRRFPRRRLAAAVAALLVATPAAMTAPLAEGVRYGDAVPGIVRPPDLEILKDRLNLTRFSVIAAVRLGSLEGRELIIAEPLPEEAIEQIEESCAEECFCPDPYGFVASRVRIVHLRDRDVATILTVDGEARDAQGRIFAPSSFDLPGRLIGWNGYAEAASGHVVLVLTPIVRVDDDDPVRAADLRPAGMHGRLGRRRDLRVLQGRAGVDCSLVVPASGVRPARVRN